MRFLTRLLILSGVMPIFGCGAGNFVNSLVATPDLSGNWEFASGLGTVAGSIPVAPTTGLLLVGSLTSQGSTVTGIFRLADLSQPNSCSNPLQQVVTVSGTIDPSRNLTLTSAAFGGSVLTMQLTIAPTPGTGGTSTVLTSGSGTVSITGGPCAYPSAGVFGFEIASVTGTYAGPITAVSGLGTMAIPSGAASLVLTQTATPQSDGQLPVTGSLTFTGGGCTSSVPLSGTVSGPSLTLTSAPSGLLNLSNDTLRAIVDPVNGGLTVPSLTYSLGPCHTGFTAFSIYTGSLTRQ